MAVTDIKPTRYDNIIQHLMGEEGYRSQPYPDPNFRQANIGYGHSFYFFTPQQLQAASKYKDKTSKWQFLLSQIPKDKLQTNWDKKKAMQQLVGDYTKHRNRAQAWLDSHDMGDDEKLVDQLGLLFFGATGGKFMESYGAKKAIKDKDNDALSKAASLWGRHVNGKLESYAVKRRVAERNYYLGKELPVRDSVAKEPIRGTVIPRPDKKSPDYLDMFRKPLGAVEWPEDLSFDLFTNPEEVSQYVNAEMGKEGTKRANEAAWKILHGDTKPMDEGFDAVQWAADYKPTFPHVPDYRSEFRERGIEIPDGMKLKAPDPEAIFEQFKSTGQLPAPLP
jgi:GH24 family phage-related lysozyme (muramidase)